MHVQVVTDDAPVGVQNLQQSSSDNVDSSGFRAAVEAAVADGDLPPEVAAPATAPSNTPVVKSEFDKTPRNAPCPCGSGKKFKMCHGRGAA